MLLWAQATWLLWVGKRCALGHCRSGTHAPCDVMRMPPKCRGCTAARAPRLWVPTPSHIHPCPPTNNSRPPQCLAPTYMGDFHLRGADLRRRGLNRIGNLLVPNSNYCKFEDWVVPILDAMLEEQRTQGTLWTPSRVGGGCRLGMGLWGTQSLGGCFGLALVQGASGHALDALQGEAGRGGRREGGRPCRLGLGGWHCRLAADEFVGR